jgi:PIN domain nuclease of toxin-antitoxin system
LNILKDSSNEIHISSISFWEISLKFSFGKLSLDGCTPDELPSLATQMGLEIIDATADELSSIHKLPNIHKYPFDRLIIHQAS